MSAERCPGCGAREAELHWGGCPWSIVHMKFGPKGLASTVFADHYWREYWHPKVGDFVVDSRLLSVQRIACLDAFLPNKGDYRPAWPDEIAAFTGAGTQASEKKPEVAAVTREPVVPAPSSADPAMAAFIEDRRAAMRKALHPPAAFELGVKERAKILSFRCPCCNPHGKILFDSIGKNCPECNGSGLQGVRV